MRNSSLSERQAFTLVEIMIIVALIGLLAALATPTFIKARKQSQGKRIVSDARIIDAAIDQWALESGKKDGDTIGTLTTSAAAYLKTSWLTNDLLGNPYVVNNVGTNQFQISPDTKAALSGVAIDWGPY